jgi:hypothetical protein
LLIEVEALKREISELRDWQERKSVELIALQKANQYLRSSSIEVGPWFSQLRAPGRQPFRGSPLARIRDRCRENAIARATACPNSDKDRLAPQFSWYTKTGGYARYRL